MDANKSYSPTYIDGKPYAVMLPTGGRFKGEPNQWDDILDLLGAGNDRFHYEKMYSWCQDIPKKRRACRALRGYSSARDWDYYHASSQYANVGFRPALVPLNPDTLRPDSSAIQDYKDGSIFRMGSLYMNSKPLLTPQNPVWNGDIPDYTPGAKLTLGDSSSEPREQIQWLKAGDLLVADRNLLRSVSWNDLNAQGLVFAKEAEIEKGAQMEPQKSAPQRLDELIRAALKESDDQVIQNLPPEKVAALYNRIQEGLASGNTDFGR